MLQIPLEKRKRGKTLIPRREGGEAGERTEGIGERRPTRNGRERHQRVCNERLRIRSIKGQKASQEEVGIARRSRRREA